MAVYVDDMYRYPMGRYRGMRMSHMIADTEQELHEMAKKIGVARKWYQGDHYDIAMSKRELAIKLGAKPIPMRQLSRMTLQRRRDRAGRRAQEDFTQGVEGVAPAPGAPGSALPKGPPADSRDGHDS